MWVLFLWVTKERGHEILDEEVGVCPLCYRSINYKTFRDGRLKYELIKSHVLLFFFLGGVNFNQDLRLWSITNKASYSVSLSGFCRLTFLFDVFSYHQRDSLIMSDSGGRSFTDLPFAMAYWYVLHLFSGNDGVMKPLFINDRGAQLIPFLVVSLHFRCRGGVERGLVGWGVLSGNVRCWNSFRYEVMRG